jgi:hypothetical protein
MLVVCSLYHSGALLRNSTLNYFRPADAESITVSEKRFEPLRAQMSRMRCNKVGYITNMMISPRTLDLSC